MTMDDGEKTKRFSDFKMLVAQGQNNSITPDFNHLSTTTPQRPGARKFGQRIESKMFSIPIVLSESDWSKREHYYNELKMFLFDDLGESIPIEVIFDYEVDKFYILECSDITIPNRRKNHDEFEISFIAYDPYKYSVLQNDEINWGSEILTFESYSYTFGHENEGAEFNINSKQNISINVVGLALQPIIHLKGTATDLVIENKGKKIEVGNFSESTWIIDTGKFISYLNGNEKIIKMDNFILHKGLNEVNFAGSNIDIKVTLRFRNRWL